MKTIITYNNVIRYYGKTKALNGLSYKLEKGECTALVGNNGSGKTTTIHILCNIIKYHGGEVYFEDQRVTPKFVSYKGKLGIVLSKPYYIEEFNVVEYWKFVCKFQKVPKNEIANRIESLIKLLDLEKDKNKPIKKLSSGNQMKVTIGSALIHNPEMVVMDEPFINIDIETTEKLMDILKSIKGKKTIFITSHHLDLVMELCDNFLILDNGKIIQNISKADFDNIKTLKARIKDLLIKEKEKIDLSWLH